MSNDNPIIQISNKLYDKKKYGVVIELLVEYLESSENDHEAHYWAGKCYYKQDNYRSAIIHFEKTLCLQNNNIDYLEWAGNSHFKLDEYSKAKECYLKALELNPIKAKTFKTYNDLGDCYYGLKEFESAIDSFQESLFYQENNCNALKGLGDCYYKIEDYSNSIEYYNRALNSTQEISENAEILNSLGWSYYGLDDDETAITHFEKSLKNNSDNWNTYNGIANCYRNLEDYSNSIEYYNKALNLTQEISENADILNSLGWSYYGLKDYKTALTHFEKSLKESPDDWDTYNGMGAVYNEQNNYLKAVEFYKKAVSKCEDKLINAEMFRSIGWCFEELKDYNKSIEYFHKGLECDSNSAYLHDGIGYVYLYHIKDFNRAYEYYLKAVEFSNEKDDVILFDLAYCYSKLRMDYEERETYKKVLKINPKYATAHNNLGYTYFKLREYDKAIFHYNEAININPDDRMPIRNLAETYEAINDFSNAIKIWEIYTRNGVLLPKAVKNIAILKNKLNSKNSETKIVTDSNDNKAESAVDPIEYYAKSNNNHRNSSVGATPQGYRISKEYILENEIYNLINRGVLFDGELKIFKDKYGNLGKQYYTDVGIIDLLCISEKENKLVVIELKRGRGSDKVVGQISRYIGYIKKKVADKDQKVEGIIILLTPDRKLEYAVSAHDNISVLKYKANITLE